MNKAILEFLKYTNEYLKYQGRIELKMKHSFRVMRLCEELALNLGLSEEEIEIAKLIGLLHDIGRFEQWKSYETFIDKDSFDHADFGVKVLKEDNYLRKFNKNSKYDEIILKSIKYHNKYLLPKNLTKKEKMFCEIIRDADKLDILYLFTIKELTVDVDDAFSKEVYESLLRNENIDKKKLINKTDRLSIFLGYIFDVNYLFSIKYLHDRNYLDTIIDIFIKKTDNKTLKKQLGEVRKVINNYIKERITC